MFFRHVIPESSDDDDNESPDKKSRLTLDKKDSLAAEQPTGLDQKGLKVTKYYEFDISTPEVVFFIKNSYHFYFHENCFNSHFDLNYRPICDRY